MTRLSSAAWTDVAVFHLGREGADCLAQTQQEAELAVPLRRRKNTDIETGVQDISFLPHIPVQTNLHLRAQSAVSIPSSPRTTCFHSPSPQLSAPGVLHPHRT